MRFISMVGRMVSLDTLSRSALSRRAMIRGVMLGLVSGITLGLATSVASAAEEEVVFGDDYIPTVLISGANRGIGLEFAHQYADRGWRVIATCRKPDAAEELKKIASHHPDLVVIEQLDVVDDDRIEELAEKYAETPIDLLLLNAGISGGTPAQTLGKMDYEVFEDVLMVNTVAPMMMSEAFLDHVKVSRDKKIVVVSSSEGSIAGATQPRLYFYRSSKAAVNMLMKNLALQVKRRGVSVAMVNPGMTDTDFMAGLPKKMLRPTEEAVTDMIRNIDGLTVETTGSFYQYDGTIIAW
jgi:NAD(P)-dependent dehydrogenase (short-subunit alcohol dehydrogenase family)